MNDHVVYGWFINDDQHLLKKPTSLTNEDGTRKCIYIGKTVRGSSVRMAEHKRSAFRQFYKDGREYLDYHTTKYKTFRYLTENNIDIEEVVLCELTSDEEFLQYLKYMIADHPVTNEKYGDRITNFEEEMKAAMKSGEIKTEEDFNKKLEDLIHQKKMAEDEEYRLRGERRNVKVEKQKMREWLLEEIEEARLGPVVMIFFNDYSVWTKVNIKALKEKREWYRVGCKIPFEEVRKNLTMWNDYYLDVSRLRVKTKVEAFVEDVLNRYDSLDELKQSLGIWSFNYE